MGSEWVAIDDESVAEDLLVSTEGFHDAVVTGGEWQGAEFVNRRGDLELLGYGRLCLEVQCQAAGSGVIKLRLNGVSSFSYDYDLDHEAMIAVEPQAVKVKIGAWKAVAERIEYRMV